jgi:hypothetical protein
MGISGAQSGDPRPAASVFPMVLVRNGNSHVYRSELWGLALNMH